MSGGSRPCGPGSTIVSIREIVPTPDTARGLHRVSALSGGGAEFQNSGNTHSGSVAGEGDGGDGSGDGSGDSTTPLTTSEVKDAATKDVSGATAETSTDKDSTDAPTGKGNANGGLGGPAKSGMATGSIGGGVGDRVDRDGAVGG